MTQLTVEQWDFISAYRKRHGVRWKSKMRDAWCQGRDSNIPVMRQLRNNLGVRGLEQLNTDDIAQVETPSDTLHHDDCLLAACAPLSAQAELILFTSRQSGMSAMLTRTSFLSAMFRCDEIVWKELSNLRSSPIAEAVWVCLEGADADWICHSLYASAKRQATGQLMSSIESSCLNERIVQGFTRVDAINSLHGEEFKLLAAADRYLAKSDVPGAKLFLVTLLKSGMFRTLFEEGFAYIPRDLIGKALRSNAARAQVGSLQRIDTALESAIEQIENIVPKAAWSEHGLDEVKGQSSTSCSAELRLVANLIECAFPEQLLQLNFEQDGRFLRVVRRGVTLATLSDGVRDGRLLIDSGELALVLRKNADDLVERESAAEGNLNFAASVPVIEKHHCEFTVT